MMTRTATELLLAWAQANPLEKQRAFCAFLEDELKHYSEPKHGGVTGRVMEAMLENFEKGYGI